MRLLPCPSTSILARVDSGLKPIRHSLGFGIYGGSPRLPGRPYFPVYKSITRESNERETMDRLLDLGFAEMGFGRFGSAVPLGEAISLVAFDASVPEVLENLRAARQPSGSREVRAVNEFCVQIRVRGRRSTCKWIPALRIPTALRLVRMWLPWSRVNCSTQ